MRDPMLLWAAIKLGAFFSLLALAYFLVHRCTGIMNFAVGAYAMVGAMAYAHFTSSGMAIPLAVVLALCLSALASVVSENLIIRPIGRSKQGEFGTVLALVASLTVLGELAGDAFGRNPLSAPPFAKAIWRVAGVTISSSDVMAVVASLAVVVAIVVWLNRGRYGRMLRAVGDDEAAAAGMGLSVPLIRSGAAALAGTVAGIAGVTYAPRGGVAFDAATYFSVAGVIAFVLGGGFLAWGVLLGGALVGIIEVYGVVVIGSSSRDYIFLGVLLGLFAVRPQGLLSVKDRV